MVKFNTSTYEATREIINESSATSDYYIHVIMVSFNTANCGAISEIIDKSSVASISDMYDIMVNSNIATYYVIDKLLLAKCQQLIYDGDSSNILRVSDSTSLQQWCPVCITAQEHYYA